MSHHSFLLAGVLRQPDGWAPVTGCLQATCHRGIQYLFSWAMTPYLTVGTLFERFAGGFQGFTLAHFIGAFGDLGNAGDCG